MHLNKSEYILQLNNFLKLISQKYCININYSKHKRRILLHFFKSHFLVRLFMRLTFFYLNIISIVCYQKKIQKLEYEQFFKLINFFKSIKILQINKVIQLFYALLVIHFDANENKRRPYLHSPKLNKKYYENIVVGSGPGGSITAQTLLSHSKDVLLIEKGDWISHFQLKYPGNEFLNKWKNGGLAVSLGKTPVEYVSAECFGGGSEINSGIYHAPDKTLLNNWFKKYKTLELSPQDIENYITETKKQTNISLLKDQHSLIVDYLTYGAKKNNWKIEEAPRWVFKEKNEYKKKSMTESYLKDYLNINGNFILNSSVVNITKKNSYWKIKVKRKNETIFLKCMNLFLCCGAIYANFLLKNSHIIKNNNEIYFHPMAKIIAKFPKKINSESMGIIPQQITEFYPSHIIGGAESGLQFLKIASFDSQNFYNEVLEKWEYMSIFHVTFSLGKGKVFKLPYSADPIVTYQLNKNDLKIIKQGMKNLCKLLIDAGADYIYPLMQNSKKLDHKSYNDFIENINEINKINFTSVHILGGAPMGENKICVTDSFGKVLNHENLYINDSSLICNRLLKNPQGTVMAIALRNISKFLKK